MQEVSLTASRRKTQKHYEATRQVHLRIREGRGQRALLLPLGPSLSTVTLVLCFSQASSFRFSALLSRFKQQQKKSFLTECLLISRINLPPNLKQSKGNRHKGTKKKLAYPQIVRGMLKGYARVYTWHEGAILTPTSI